MPRPLPSPFPSRPGADAGDGALVDIALVAGAQMLRLRGACADPDPVRTGWCDRLVLVAAARACARVGRSDTVAQLRDLWHGGDGLGEMGPSGNLLKALRRVYGLPWMQAADAVSTAFLDFAPAAVTASATQMLRDPVRDDETSPAVVARIFAAIREAAPEAAALAPLCADIALARLFGLSITVPAASLGLSRFGVRSEGPALARVLLEATVRGADEACSTLPAFLAAARALREARPRLRARGADVALEALLLEESVYPPRLARRIGDRAGRRLFERLAALGLVRETTGRAYFRIYALVGDERDGGLA